ncbi:hypothetical protein K443DRAFT_611821 [Laccaria amethystina LaAM-08-1]|uniref:RNA-dependent RNA polymerase n=1 Tax=Laccaria amethystina LaAM-08-1 TaxID=1095629 RepID=A0A0C9X5W6_9AGAR|nr:hypothetical protein K443DRAFT_611821 [Laccaria amethystina LaAM-08-1]
MLHPQLDAEGKHLAQFRKSMKKFTTTTDHTFSVVGHSRPYTFGRLNNDIIVLLSSLGVTNEKLLNKQDEYFQWLRNATEDPTAAVDFLSCIDQYPLAGKVLLNGINDPDVARDIRRLQLVEISRYTDEREKFKSRMIIRESRRLFGVCDPFQVLKEGEVHIRIMASRKGPSTPIHGDVLIVRNPCLHPGDCLKLRAVHNDKLSHLVDCLVFASVARPGHHAAPSMSSGGDLDGDEFLVCWDKDLVPPRISESYDYPGNKERISKKVTREDLAVHFASYNAAGLARVSALHNKWARYHPLGALSVECQELNALHSQSVDGAGIKIPERLTKPPEATEPFIIDLLEQAARKFAAEFMESKTNLASIPSLDAEQGQKLVSQLFKSTQHAVTEYELFELAYRLAQKYQFDLCPYLGQIDWSAITAMQKRAISTTLSLSSVDYPYMWNSLVKSDILMPQDLYSRSLHSPFSIQRLYSSKEHGLTTFFEYLRMATQDYTRKLLVIQTERRFSVGIFMRGNIPWDEEPEVNDNVVVCSFLPESSSTIATQRPCSAGYRLHLSDSKMELYNRQRSDTFIFINRQLGTEVVVSIALQKISSTVQRQLGRVNRSPLIGIELHVVSNHDRVAHQLFDLWFQHVPTEEYVRRFQRQSAPYRMNDLKDVDWSKEPDWLKSAFYPAKNPQGLPSSRQPKTHTQETMDGVLSRRMLPELDQILDFGLMYHAEDEVSLVFHYLLLLQPFPQGMVVKWIDKYPPLVFTALKVYPPDEDLKLPPETEQMTRTIVQAIIRSANDLRIASLVALEKIAGSIALLPIDEYIELLMLAALSVRSSQLVQEVLLVMNDIRLAHCPQTPVLEYGHKHALGVVFDRAEEAADECPCNEDGKPRKQRNPPSQTNLTFVPDDTTHVMATLRVDAKTAIRLHSHVRLQATSKAENRWIDAPVLDGLVVQAMKGELKIKLLHPAPPETERMDWVVFNAGSIATSRAMLDALLRLLTQKQAACLFYSFITGDEEEAPEDQQVPSVEVIPPGDDSGLNESQRMAVQSWAAPLSLIWGPPGTGKTTVVVDILRSIIKTYYPQTPKILMTASTHNAVDNVLERFVKINEEDQLLREEQILRVATDQSKVNQDLQHFTIDARIGGDMNQNSRLVKQAQERVERSVLVFTTCAGESAF